MVEWGHCNFSAKAVFIDAIETNRLVIDHLCSGDLVDLHRMDSDLSVDVIVMGRLALWKNRKNISLKIL